MKPIRQLLDRDQSRRRTVLPARLRRLYAGDLRFPVSLTHRPYVIANFVSTLDGIVSFNLPGQLEGKYISGSNEGDHFIMGLLRASADAVIVGSSTFRAAGPKALWTPESLYPAAAGPYRQYRKSALKKAKHPLLVIVSGTGALDLGSPMFHQSEVPVVIITSEQGRRRLTTAGSEALSRVTVRVTETADQRLDPSAILEVLRQEFGVRLLLHEGGPTLFGTFLAKALVDELFLTIAPQIAGSTAAKPRPRLTAFVEFLPATAPWWKLASVRNAGDHLYLRYRRRQPRASVHHGRTL